VSVGDVADTAEFAVESIRRWWNQMGRLRFPKGHHLDDYQGCPRLQRAEGGVGVEIPHADSW